MGSLHVCALLALFGIVAAGEYCQTSYWGPKEYCYYGCCGSGYSEYCCSSWSYTYTATVTTSWAVYVGVGVGCSVLFIIVVIVVIVCICNKSTKRGRVIGAAPSHGIAISTVSSNTYNSQMPGPAPYQPPPNAAYPPPPNAAYPPGYTNANPPGYY